MTGEPDSKPGLLSDLGSGSCRALTHADERLHPPPDGAVQWTETSWWAFNAQSGDLGGWVYLQARPTLGVLGLGVWVWDASSALPWRLQFARQYSYLPFPAGADYDDLELDAPGLRLRCIEPFARHEMRFSSEGLNLDLCFEARTEAQPLGITDRTGHLDQLLWATGALELAGTTVTVDGAACRDRTWSERAETSPTRKNSYVWGLGADTGFHALLMIASDGVTPAIAAGTRTDRGVARPLTSIRRSVQTRDPVGRPTRMTLELEGADGKTTVATGEATSGAAILAFSGYLTWTSVVRWELAGEELWGEDHESWPLSAIRAAEHGASGADPWAVRLTG